MKKRIVAPRKESKFKALGYKKVKEIEGRGGSVLLLMEKPEPKVIKKVKRKVVSKKPKVKVDLPEPKTNARGVFKRAGHNPTAK